ncbi:unnamed protein product, partial [Choristocarpus tenellus]
QVLLKCLNVTLAFSKETPEGLGNLFITSSRVVWLSQEDVSKAFEFDVPYFCLHAVSRDPETFPSPCLYCQLAEEEEDLLKEVFFAPGDKEQLQPMFDAFSRAAELNPDPMEAGHQEGDDELIFDHDSVTLNAEQARVLAHLDSVLVVPDGMEVHEGKFDDADIQGEEGEEDAEEGGQLESNGGPGPAPSS